MHVLDGDFAGSLVFNGGLEAVQLTADQKSIIEEDTWEQVQQALNNGDIAQQDAEMYLYQLHDRIQQLGESILQAS